MPPRDHARLFPPSSSKRWLSCAPSAILSAVAPKKDDDPAAVEGTLAHKVCEGTILAWWKQMKGILSPSLDISCAYHLNDTYKTARVNEIMVQECQGYVDAIIEAASLPGAKVVIEQRLDYSFKLGLPAGCAYGSFDAMTYDPATKTIKIWDFKYGKWPVEPDHNTQTLCYLIAALNAYRILFDIRYCEIVIYQPRIPGKKKYRSWATTIEDVDAFGKWAFLKARKVLTAEEYYNAGGVDNIPINMFVPTDDNCQFCKAVTCPARRRLIFK